ncbi:hypothetical protein V8C86DRAFT_2784053 [Haematococcus lacustris]
MLLQLLLAWLAELKVLAWLLDPAISALAWLPTLLLLLTLRLRRQQWEFNPCIWLRSGVNRLWLLSMLAKQLLQGRGLGHPRFGRVRVPEPAVRLLQLSEWAPNPCHHVRRLHLAMRRGSP